MSTFREQLLHLGACTGAIAWVGDRALDDAWRDCERADWMIWLLTRLDQHRGIGVGVEVVRATCAHLVADDATTDVLNPLAVWAAGDDTVDLARVCHRAWEIRCAAAAAAAATAYIYAVGIDDVIAAQAYMIRDLVPCDEVRGILEIR